MLQENSYREVVILVLLCSSKGIIFYLNAILHSPHLMITSVALKVHKRTCALQPH